MVFMYVSHSPQCQFRMCLIISILIISLVVVLSCLKMLAPGKIFALYVLISYAGRFSQLNVTCYSLCWICYHVSCIAHYHMPCCYSLPCFPCLARLPYVSHRSLPCVPCCSTLGAYYHVPILLVTVYPLTAPCHVLLLLCKPCYYLMYVLILEYEYNAVLILYDWFLVHLDQYICCIMSAESWNNCAICWIRLHFKWRLCLFYQGTCLTGIKLNNLHNLNKMSILWCFCLLFASF